MIEITVTEVIDVSIKRAYEMLNAHEDYSKWWTLPTRTKGTLPDYFEFTPLPFVRIGLRKIRVVKNRSIEFEYIKGPFRGTATWKLKELENHTISITYYVQIKPTNAFYRLLANSNYFAAKHTKDIRRIIEQLKLNCI
jgi:uncharacterized protein YndB with AHSA1/START domain